ncbi:plasmid replication protein RepC [Microvirga arsenatis]|uniref:Replication initiation protein RepC n=1 Tax=Microvirga arsenatis TaxID=2692265 RepID=A0ABW9Z696_9HYPH|nr:plasmid replication protein RepC [Microvirga arsenatis]NBJ13766.1 replication initiation protein RepC [Microvirga arsenatis]NBJ27220.1 replication initiation protein RepC [Microvirga arsenatis]
MTAHQSTTPFGRRPLSLAMVAARAVAEAGPKEALADKWKVLDNLREAKTALGISDRALSVLNALLTFHQDTTLQLGSDLIVFPSNKALTFRANGMSPATLRRHLAALVQAGLVIRRDSPNGKRYARRGEGGAIEQAFGFDLSPLVARAAEFESLADQARAERKARYLLREEITVLRRDISKTIAVALEEDLPGPWADLSARFDALNEAPPRSAEPPALEAIASDLRALWSEVDNTLKSQLKPTNMSVYESHSERHYQNSKPNILLDSEQGLQRRLEETSAPEPEARKSPTRAFSLTLVLQACPDIAMYTKGGQGISTWRELVTAAGVVRGALGISPSAWEDACAVMGEEDAAIVVAAMLQRSEMIVSAGGYLRNLTERAREGKFSVGPMVMALLRVQAGKEPRRA